MIDSYTVDQARNTDLVAFLERRSGFTFTHRGDAFRCLEHPSFAVKADRSSWYWHSQGLGGFGVLDYLTKIERLSFREAVEAVAPHSGEAIPRFANNPPEQKKTLVLPERAGTPLKLYDYLCLKRGIDRQIVDALLQEGKLYQDRRGNVVFVGFDEHDQPRYASLRGTYAGNGFRMECAGSDKRYSFSMAYRPSGLLYLYESPIDAMSHSSLENAASGDSEAWRLQNRLSLGGTSDKALQHYLQMQPGVSGLVFCLDNDAAGREAATALLTRYTEQGYQTSILLPSGKDYNEDLLQLRREVTSKQKSGREISL